MIGLKGGILMQEILNDVSPLFRWNPYDSMVAKNILKYEGTPEAIKYFSKVCDKLSNYSYWFLLSTLWVSYTGYSDLELWKKLLSSSRGQKKRSIMKPSEVAVYNNLPYFVKIYRAHRPNEKDWIAYTLKFDIAIRFALERHVEDISEYLVKKKDVAAVFMRRGEHEIIVLDKDSPTFIKKHKLCSLKTIEQLEELKSTIQTKMFNSDEVTWFELNEKLKQVQRQIEVIKISQMR